MKKRLIRRVSLMLAIGMLWTSLPIHGLALETADPTPTATATANPTPTATATVDPEATPETATAKKPDAHGDGDG